MFIGYTKCVKLRSRDRIMLPRVGKLVFKQYIFNKLGSFTFRNQVLLFVFQLFVGVSPSNSTNSKRPLLRSNNRCTTYLLQFNRVKNY